MIPNEVIVAHVLETNKRILTTEEVSEYAGLDIPSTVETLEKLEEDEKTEMAWGWIFVPPIDRGIEMYAGNDTIASEIARGIDLRGFESPADGNECQKSDERETKEKSERKRCVKESLKGLSLVFSVRSI